MLTARIDVTSFHPGSSGGGVVVGRERGREVRALIRAAVLPREPRAGETWRVTGPPMTAFVQDHRTGARVAIRQIAAEVAVPLEPSGAGIRRWIARNRDIPGVGAAYADRLWDALGPRLYDHLRRREVTPIAKVLDLPKAHAIVDAWALMTDEVTALEDLDRLGVSGSTANAALRLFGASAAGRFAANPYLVSLLEPWRETDAAALAAGLAPDDRRRLEAAVDIAAAESFRTTEFHLGGHTAVTRKMLRPRVRQLLGISAEALAEHAIDTALASGALRLTGNSLLQARGPWHMEREIEEDLAARLAMSRAAVPRQVIGEAIAEIELEDGLVLEPEQALAVAMALTSGVSSISGGAGTGKSMVCKAILRALHRLHPPRTRQRRGVGQEEVTCCMVAVSGRAAKVLRDATDGGAMTVHRYLAAREAGRLWFERGLLVVDEASMVGTPDLWRILSVTPRAAGVLLVGDVAQLPPIRAGYPAKVLATAQEVPRVTLAAVHRQAAVTGIPGVSAQVREGRPPPLDMFDFGSSHRPGVRLLACSVQDVPFNVLRVFEAFVGPPVPCCDTDALARLHGGDVQILCVTNSGPAGAKEIGDSVECRWMAAWPPVHDWGLKVGSKILWTRNSYDRRSNATREHGGEDADGSSIDIMNGSLGIVRRPGSGEKRTAAVSFDGADDEVEIDETDRERLVRGWAMTVHKAQGSSFRHVILPLVPSRLLDRAMLYTALTRARISVVLVGDPALLAASILPEPRAWHRLQALDPDAAIRAQRDRGPGKMETVP